MPTKTFFMTNTLLSSMFQEITETSPGAAATTSPNTGWTLAKIAAGNYSHFDAQTESASGNFNTTVKPGSTFNAVVNAGNGLRTANPITGRFEAGTWTLTFALRSVGAAASGSVRIRCRIWRSSDPQGTLVAPTDILGADQVGTSTGALSTSSDKTSVVTISMPQVDLNNEYLFITVACEIVIASGSNSADAIFRIGTGTTTIATSNFIYAISSADSASAVDSWTIINPPYSRFTGNNLAEFTATLLADNPWGMWKMDDANPGVAHPGEETYAAVEATSQSRGAVWYNAGSGNHLWQQAIPSANLHETPRTGHFLKHGSNNTDYNNMAGFKCNLGTADVRPFGGVKRWSVVMLAALPVTSPGGSARRSQLLSGQGTGNKIIDYQCNTVAFFNTRAFSILEGAINYDCSSDIAVGDSNTTYFLLHLVYDYPDLKFYINGALKATFNQPGGLWNGGNTPTDIYCGFHRDISPYGAPGVSGEVDQQWVARLAIFDKALKPLDIWRHNEARLNGGAKADNAFAVDTEGHTVQSTKIANGADDAPAVDTVARSTVGSRGTSDSAPALDSATRQAIYQRQVGLGPGYRNRILGLSGLTNFWELEESAGAVADDLVGTSDGTYVNAPTLQASPVITTGKAVSFNGTDEELTLPGPQPGAEFSFETWFKTSHTAGVALMRDDTGTGGWIFGFKNVSTFAIRINGTNLNTSLAWTSVANGNSHHLVITRSSSNSVRVYVDGNLVAGPTTLSGTTPTMPWHLAKNGTIAEYLQVTFDEIAFYSRELTATEVSDNYTSGTTVPTSEDTAYAVDSVERNVTKTANTSDNASAVDTLDDVVARGRVTDDSAPVVDTVTRSTVAARGISDSASAVDSTSRSTVQVRSISDMAPAVESSTRQTTQSRTPGDSAPATDSNIRSTVVSRNVSDTAPAVLTQTRQVTESRQVADNASASESVSRQTIQARGTPDSALAVDTVFAEKGASINSNDSAPAVDSVVATGRVYINTDDSAPAVDTVNTSHITAFGVSDSAPSIDSVVRQTLQVRQIADAAPSVDTLSNRSSVQTREIADVASASDSVSRVTLQVRSMSDSANATDSSSKTTMQPRFTSDTAQASDSATRSSLSSRNTLDTAVALDVVLRQMVAYRQVNESAPATESLELFAGQVRAQVDSAPAVDSVTRQTAQFRSITDTSLAVDSVARLTTQVRIILESASATDSVDRHPNLTRITNDQAFATDTVTRGTFGTRVTFDLAVATDAVSTLGVHPIFTVDAAPAVDIVSVTFTEHGRGPGWFHNKINPGSFDTDPSGHLLATTPGRFLG